MYDIYLRLPFQSSFHLHTDSDELVHSLSLRYGRYVGPSAEYECDFYVSATKHGDAFRLSSENSTVISNTPLLDIDRFMFDKTVYDSKVLALHGAAVEWNGGCHIFLAATTSGKTTLTSYLTSRGFGYLTDDCILIDREKLCVYPCSTPIQLRDGGTAVLRSYGALPDTLELLDEPPTLKRFVYTPQACADQSLPLKSIYFIKLTDGKCYVEDMSTTERMTELLRSPITPYAINAEHLRLMSRLAKIPCKRLYYNDMDFVKELIQNG